jgi:uncharacterized membrane protein YcaP (DUF421 family)
MLISLIRTVILYAVIMTAMRVLGKRQIGELEPSELAITILISELASVPMQDPDQPMLTGLVPICTLLSLGAVTSYLTMISPVFRRMMYGKPSIIIKDGKLVQREINSLRLNLDEITEELRLKDVTDISTVKYGIVETNGQLSIIRYNSSNPVALKDLNIPGGTTPSLPYTLVSNGKLMRSNLKICGLKKEDILSILRERNIPSYKKVYYMYVDGDNNYTVIKKEKG